MKTVISLYFILYFVIICIGKNIILNICHQGEGFPSTLALRIRKSLTLISYMQQDANIQGKK
jgi:hypothetical protein